MSENHLPRHRRSYAKELHTAIQVIEYLKKQGAIYPTPNIHTGDLAEVIGLGMGTVKDDQVAPKQQPVANDFSDLIDE